MALFLVQHGLSESKEVDPEKGLSQTGKEESLRIATVAKAYNIGVKKIVHSGKKRARQTAEIYHLALDLKPPIEEISGISPLDNVEKFAEKVALDENCMVFGHMPFMERLVSYLTSGDACLKVYQFQNSGIVCLDAEKGNNDKLDWFIKWTLNPNIS